MLKIQNILYLTALFILTKKKKKIEIILPIAIVIVVQVNAKHRVAYIRSIVICKCFYSTVERDKTLNSLVIFT